MKSAGTLKVSNRIWAAVSRFDRGFRGGSVSSTGCCQTKIVSHDFVVTCQLYQNRQPPASRTSSLNVFNSSVYTNCQILSISSQSVTIPCSRGYFIFSKPRSSWAFCPMKTSPSSAPARTLRCFGRPTNEGK